MTGYKLTLSLIVLSLSGWACVPEVAVSNPYDPELPAEQQQEALIKGAIQSATEDGAAGLAIEGARVELLGPTEPVTNPIITGVDGEFNFGEVMPGRYTVTVSHASYLRQVRDVVLEAGEEVELQIVLDSGIVIEEQAHLSGVAHKTSQLSLSEDLADHSGIVVEVVGMGLRTVTNMSGQFDIFLAAGTYNLSFSASNHVSAFRDDVVAVAGADTVVPESPVVLAANPATLHGVAMMRSCAANPDDEVEVEAEDAIAALVGTSFLATVDSDGAFSITGIPAGIYTLRITQDGYFASEVAGISL
ncbi:carboxypeptidase regulatory-like domain-containing protein, partial [Myxococcota bacterium]|nr:carboxypeptidase regulatory-like domain-containing protein [Myxococcota bacterium]